MDFPFHQVYGLDDYNNADIPSVFFGMYRYEDECVLSLHNGKAVVFWTGQDALNHNFEIDILAGKHVTAHPKVYKLLIENKYECQLVKPASFFIEQKPQTLGKKIYAYCPNSSPGYHGRKIIDALWLAGYEIVIGDGLFSQAEWRNGKADFFYKDIFIGLCLSEFAGGGLSIIEMGLRGISVVTNVFNLPNCIPWNSIEDITQAINDESEYIGHTNRKLAENVWDSLDHKHEWLNI